MILSLELPEYWTPRPAIIFSDKEVTAFKSMWAKIEHSTELIPTITLPLSIERWHFLDWLVQAENVLLHGSAKGDIDLFRPRLPNDYSADDFSKQLAVYATTDAIWSIYYAILNRSHGQRHLNACLQFQQGSMWSNLHYFFSLDHKSHAQNPWRTGFVYLLPATGFVQQSPYHVQTWTVLDPHFANSQEVRPLARVEVKPTDFPLLSEVREHADAAIISAQTLDPSGFPWLNSR